MNKKDYPEGFPLESIDAEGNELKSGDTVKILRIPEWLLNNLDEDAIKIIKNCEGSLMKIYEVDEYGYMWVEKPTLDTEELYESHSFSMEPSNLVKS
ncbi:MAG: hypothetical protein N0C84_09900 [Candidatus Thiodiazotropha taylori]|uniref:Uncharacterized protein n=1 Tax=Candidatus Thiodiazotropha taylori TaxID=2792791 RepID=A0A9E4KE26_9GAMM|nr:hypothetical protein [Candidatus Thiodiazotropha taylori]MCW4256760.1 hypothetical protein [Candidatus Thiodiazotropha taylori]